MTPGADLCAAPALNLEQDLAGAQITSAKWLYTAGKLWLLIETDRLMPNGGKYHLLIAEPAIVLLSHAEPKALTHTYRIELPQCRPQT
jgi:hypothetical protein